MFVLVHLFKYLGANLSKSKYACISVPLVNKSICKPVYLCVHACAYVQFVCEADCHVVLIRVYVIVRLVILWWLCMCVCGGQESAMTAGPVPDSLVGRESRLVSGLSCIYTAPRTHTHTHTHARTHVGADTRVFLSNPTHSCSTKPKACNSFS